MPAEARKTKPYSQRFTPAAWDGIQQIMTRTGLNRTDTVDLSVRVVAALVKAVHEAKGVGEEEMVEVLELLIEDAAEGLP